MKSASLYVFIALGALLISHTSAAPTSGLSMLGKDLIKLLVSSNEQAEAEKSGSQTIGNQVDALIQMAYNGAQAFFDGVNEALAEEQQYGGGYSGGYVDAASLANLKAHVNNFLGTTFKLASDVFGK
jgi:hypothetical protein